VLEHLFSPLDLGPAELRNRIVSTAHQTTLVSDHLPTDDFIAYHEARAAGGTGLIVLEATAVHESGRLTAHTLAGYLEEIVAGYRRVADAVHAHGTRVFVQRDTCTTPGGCDSSEEDTIVVYSVAADGTDAHEVADGDYDVSEPGWPPGQNVLAFLGDDGSNGPQAGPTEVNSLDATWSPDGTVLAVADPPTGLWLIDSDGKPQLLAKGAFSSLSWGTQVKQQAERSARR